MTSTHQALFTQRPIRLKHGRGSCQICRTRKTRCELPDPDVPRSSDPLPPDKMCHRCRVLSLPCVLETIDRPSHHRARRPTRDTEDIMPEPWSEMNIPPTPPKGSPNSGSSSLDLLSTFHPSPWGVKSSLQSTVANSPTSEESPHKAEDLALVNQCRSLELTAARIRLSFGKLGRTMEFSIAPVPDPMDLAELVNEQVRVLLEPGFQQLMTYHPYLQNVNQLFTLYSRSKSLDNTLLLALVLFLCCKSTPGNPDALSGIPCKLVSFIMAHRERFLLHLPSTKTSIQALHLLQMWAPFGYLPSQPIDSPGLIDLCRGYIVSADQLVTRLRVGMETRLTIGIDISTAFTSDELWLWLSHVAVLGCDALEEKQPRGVHDLGEAGLIASMLLGPKGDNLWDVELRGRPSQAIGRLCTCQQILGLNIALTTLQDIALDCSHAREDSSFQATPQIQKRVDKAKASFEGLDARVNSIFASHRSRLKDIGRGRMDYHGMEEAHMVHTILRSALAASCACELFKHPEFNTGSNTPISQQIAPPPGNPTPLLPPVQPKAMIELRKRLGPSRGTDGIAAIGAARGETLEKLLVTFADLTTNHLLPIHRTISLAFEACQVLLNTHHASIAINQTHREMQRSLRLPQWVFVMKQSSMRMATMEDRHDPKVETLGNMCSKLTGAMLEVIGLRTDALLAQEKDEPNDDFSSIQITSTVEDTSYPTFPVPLLNGATLDGTELNPLFDVGQLYTSNENLDQLFADVFGNVNAMGIGLVNEPGGYEWGI